MAKRLYTPKNSVYRFAEKQSGFVQYLKNRYSEYSVYRTIGYVQSSYVTEYVKSVTGESIIYDVKTVELLRNIAVKIRNSERDVKLHKVYSSAVNRYINYLSSL
jgi:hypothetical protein